ncbi:MAG TPA: hypothetical protein VFM45_12015 [Anaeromyxobacteraceae bacterium]|nr:hypothetical protein [Anaeromyxobacteraceae bacterium]
MKRPLALAVALALAGCATVPEVPAPAAPAAAVAPAVPAPEVAVLARMRDDVEALLAAQGEALWQSWTTGAPLDAAGPMRGREWLADGGALAALDAMPPANDAGEAGRRRMLRDFLVGERLAAAATRAPEPSDLSFAFEGRTLALRDSASLLAAETDAARRAAIDAARAPAAARAARADEERAAALADASRRLGLGELPALASELRRASPAALAALASSTLEATGPAYCGAMDALARGEMGTPLAATHLRDLPRILRAAHEPRAHAAARLVADGEAAATAATGAPLAGRVRLDDRFAPGKSQRPLAVPVRVPDDVRLSAMPSGGSAEARAFLHELGAALFLSGIRADGVERRRLGSPAAVETWGYLLEGLAADPAWLNERSGIVGDALSREIKAAQAERLHAVRMKAARLLRELERAGGSPPGAAGDAKVLSRALCRPVAPEDAARWPLPRDPLLTTADGLRAALLAAQIESAMADPGGGPWWRWKGAPAWLAPLWSAGTVASPDELARASGVGAVSPEPMARVARSRLSAAGW